MGIVGWFQAQVTRGRSWGRELLDSKMGGCFILPLLLPDGALFLETSETGSVKDDWPSIKHFRSSTSLRSTTGLIGRTNPSQTES